MAEVILELEFLLEDSHTVLPSVSGGLNLRPRVVYYVEDIMLELEFLLEESQPVIVEPEVPLEEGTRVHTVELQTVTGGLVRRSNGADVVDNGLDASDGRNITWHVGGE